MFLMYHLLTLILLNDKLRIINGKGKNMNFKECFYENPVILMEGAIGERLKREYMIYPEPSVALASHVYQDKSKDALVHIYNEYIVIAKSYNLPIMLTTPTRRANKERVTMSSIYNEEIIKDNVSVLKKIKSDSNGNVYMGGLMGCKGDAYKGTESLTEEEAFIFHSWQAELFRKASVDFLFAGIMPCLPEAVGMAKAMEATNLPYIISFMIRDNGRLIDHTTIHDAINTIDEKTKDKPLCYMTNCVHPSILYKALSVPFNQTDLVRERFLGIQANASNLYPEELDYCCNLKSSDAFSLANDMLKLKLSYPGIKIFGGCCGTDNTHMSMIAENISKLR
jgi:S-methylmethionine-dependent homocysteine/selenocysteine methylase